jgi:hypothetical protein
MARFIWSGAYVGVYILMLGGNFWICLVAVPLAVGLFGILVERVLIRPLYGRGIDYPLLLTFGLSYVMVELVRIAFGKTGYPFDTPEILQGAVNIGVGYFPLYRLVRDRRDRGRAAGAVAVSGKDQLRPDHPRRRARSADRARARASMSRGSG